MAKRIACLIVMLTVLAALPVHAQGLDLGIGGREGDEKADDAIRDAFGKDARDLLSGGTAVRLVRVDEPAEGIESVVFWRTIPGAVAANTFPVRVQVGPVTVIGPKTKILPNDIGLETVYEPRGRAKLKDGRHKLTPGKIPVRIDNGRLSSDHPAIQAGPKEVRLLCAPVIFEPVDENGVPAPTRLSITDGDVSVLRAKGPYSHLTVWLPVAAEYASSWGRFKLKADGTLVPLQLEPRVTAEGRTLRLTVPVPERPARAVTPPTDRLYLISHRGRRVFAQTEAPAFFVLVPRGFQGADAQVRVDGRNVAGLTLPSVEDANWDARGFRLQIADLPPGAHDLSLHADGARCEPIQITVVRWQRRSPFLVQTMSCCTPVWPTSDEGLDVLREAGVEMVTSTGHHSILNDRMPRIQPPDNADRPAELGLQRTANDLLLEQLLRHRMRMIDLTVQRAHGFYNEGLSYHHSYRPSVDRMVRRMSVFTQQTADYPSFWGVNYGWFPKLHGYVEGGVPTDAHTAARNAALAARLKKEGLSAPSRQEMKWYREHRWSEDPTERKRAADIMQRRIAWWKAWNAFGFGRHNVLYNRAVRQVRPGTRCVLFDNAGHDAGNRARSQFNDMAAVCYESYTDYGEWPMSTAFTADWARGSSPGQAVWLTVDWGTSSEGMMRSLFHGFFRGLRGGGCPMQGDVKLQELARRGRGLRLISQYGGIARFAEPDDRVGILATLSQRMIDQRAYYACHAIYSHLTRIGYPAAVIDEEDVLRRGVPEETKVLWLVRQEQPLSAPILSALEAFQKRGGQILATGDSRVELPDVKKVGGAVNDIWRLSGFHPESHQDLWREFRETWREPLTKAMAETGLPVRARTQPGRAFAVTMDVGPVRYLLVAQDTYGRHARDFVATRNLPVSLDGTGWIVRDLVHQRPVRTGEQGGRTTLTLDLVNEPFAFLALYRSVPRTVRIERKGPLLRASVQSADGAPMGRVPLRYTFVAPSGQVRDVIHRAVGDEVRFEPPALDEPGKWTVRVQELLTGLTATTVLKTTPAGQPQIADAIGDVHVVEPRHVRVFAAAEGEKVVLIEPTQRHLMPLARRLVENLRAAGTEARLWAIRPEQLDQMPLRWFPREEDKARTRLIEAAELIGYRQNMKPYIDTKARAHVPEKGGYSAIQPHWMIGRHVIVFSGGRIADSLRAVTAWMPTPNVPGLGQGRLLVCFSPFLADRHAAVIAANDQTGMTKAADRLVRFFQEDVASPVPGRAGKQTPTSAATDAEWQDVTEQTDLASVPTPFAMFSPWKRVQRLMALPDGRAALTLEGDKDTLAFVSPDGQMRSTMRLGGIELTLDKHGNIWSWTRRGGAVLVRCVTPEGRLIREFEAIDEPPHPVPVNRSLAASFPVAPDGETAALARPGAVLLGSVETGGWRFYDDLPHVRRRYEVWTPRFPVAMTFSPDSRYLFFTMGSRPTGFTNMSGYSFYPTGAESVLLNVQTGKRVWARREETPSKPAWAGTFYGGQLDSCAFATTSGFSAVSRDGAVTAIADFVGQAILIDKSGEVLVQHETCEYTAQLRRARMNAGTPPDGVGVWIAPAGELALFGYRRKLVLARPDGTVKELPVPTLVDGCVARNGAFAVAALESGDVIAVGPDGAERWRYESEGLTPRVAAVAPDATLVAFHDARLVRLDAAGKVEWETLVGPAVDRAIHEVAPAENVAGLPEPLEYREPRTLAVAKRTLKAEKVDAWRPAGRGVQRYARTFYRTQQPLRLRGGAGDVFVHLVYRRPEGSGPLKVHAGGRGKPRTFVLDLPTPQYRIVDIPVRGPDATVIVAPDGPVEIAECSLWRMRRPGPNVALVRDPKLGAGGGGMELDMGAAGDDALEIDTEVFAAGADPRGLAGRLKPTNIYFWNSDPDKVKGDYLRPQAGPLEVVDGKRFDETRMPAWSAKDGVGPWFIVDFPYAVPLTVVATYDRELRQSRLARRIAIFTGFDPEGNRDRGEVLTAAIANDQFWRLWDLRGRKLKQLGVHIQHPSGRTGLSEIEAYPAK